MAHEEEVAQLANLQKARKIVVLVAIVLLVLSFAFPNPLFVYPRAILWFIAGALSVFEGIRVKQLGQNANNAWINAAIFFVVAFLPFFRGR